MLVTCCLLGSITSYRDSAAHVYLYNIDGYFLYSSSDFYCFYSYFYSLSSFDCFRIMHAYKCTNNFRLIKQN